MASKWVITYLHMGYWGYNPLIRTFDPNLQRDIQGKPATLTTNPIRRTPLRMGSLSQMLNVWYIYLHLPPKLPK